MTRRAKDTEPEPAEDQAEEITQPAGVPDREPDGPRDLSDPSLYAH